MKTDKYTPEEIDRELACYPTQPGINKAGDIMRQLRADLAAKETLFERHTKAVGEFLNELYAISCDPLADGTMEVSEMKAALLEAAKRDRNLRVDLAAKGEELAAEKAYSAIAQGDFEEAHKKLLDISALREDIARLDWLEAKRCPGISTDWHTGLAFSGPLRAAIDEARTSSAAHAAKND